MPGHAQLAWIFNCVARLGWMDRMTQFKEKAGKDRENSSLGLFAYPSLMAADILLYHATHVPVGEDQKQHVELARDIAAKFNHDFGVDFFPMPEPVIEGAATRVMSLRDGTKKMSKSDPSDMSRINLTDDADAIAQKIRKARTDPEPLPDTVAGLAERPEAENLVNIYAAIAGTTPRRWWPSSPASRSRYFKPRLADLAVAHLSPITGRMSELMADPGRDRPHPRRRRRPGGRDRRADPRPDLRHRRAGAEPVTLRPRVSGRERSRGGRRSRACARAPVLAHGTGRRRRERARLAGSSPAREAVGDHPHLRPARRRSCWRRWCRARCAAAISAASGREPMAS